MPHSDSPPGAEIAASDLLADVSVLPLAPGTACRLTKVPLQDGIEVVTWKGRFEKPVDVALRDDSNRIHFTYALQGNARCWFEGGAAGHEHLVQEGSGSINFNPDCRGRFRQEGRFESVTVMMRPDVFAAWATDVDPSLQQALATGRCFIENHQGAELHATAQALSEALNPKRNAGSGNSWRHPLWLQAQALVLVGLFLEGRGVTADCSCNVAAADRERLIHARDRLLADLSQPPTLAELAKDSHLSMLKLKRGFRQLFGNSVYALFQQERMHEARRRLRAGDVSVVNVASDLGYTNASHFAAAFRKQFGINPSDVKRHG